MTALAPVLVPLVAAAAVLFARGRPTLLPPLAVGALVVTLATGIWAAIAEPSTAWRWSPVIELGLRVDDFGRVMVVLVPLIATPIVAYAAVTEREASARLLAIMLAFVGAMLLLVEAADFLTLLIAWELVGAASWALIAHDWEEGANVQSATQAFVTTRIGDLGLYLAAGLLFAERGSFEFAAVAGTGRPALDAIAVGVLLAAVAKSAQLPFSPWLFSAMAGPTPVSALLHSATLVAAGAYLLIRLSPSLEAVDWFLPAVAAVGLATALAGGIVATIQTHAKRVLAGSTSAQYGLMFIAVGASSTAAAGAQLVAHAAFKSLLFLGAGVAIHATGSSEMTAMRLGRAIPVVAALSFVGVLALGAVPPIGGAWTKEQIVSAAAEDSVWLAVGALAAGFLSAMYATRFQLLVWGADAPRHGQPAPPGGPHGRMRMPGPVEVAGIAALAALTIALSALWLPGGRELAEDASGGVIFEGAAWEAGASAALIAAAIGLVLSLRRRGNLLTLGLPSHLQAAAGDWLGVPAAARLLVVEPVLATSRLLASLDDRVVDAGVRLAAAVPALFSRMLSLRAEWTIDGVVRGIAYMTMVGAERARQGDEGGVDGAVEGSARGVGLMGEASRRLQTGLTHHYYAILVVGLVAIVAVLATIR